MVSFKNIFTFKVLIKYLRRTHHFEMVQQGLGSQLVIQIQSPVCVVAWGKVQTVHGSANSETRKEKAEVAWRRLSADCKLSSTAEFYPVGSSKYHEIFKCVLYRKLNNKYWVSIVQNLNITYMPLRVCVKILWCSVNFVL